MRIAVWIGLAALAAVAAIAACGSDDEPTTGAAGSSAGGGGQSSGGGKAGKGASAGAAGGGTAGSTGGSAGSSAGASSAGGEGGLTWTTSAKFLDCGVSVGLPSPTFRLFSWKACTEQPDCEEVVWTLTKLPPTGRTVLANVVDDNLGQRLVLTTRSDPGGPEYRTNAEGWVASAIRSEGTCATQFTSEFEGHFVTGLTGGPDGTDEGVVSGNVGQPGLAVWMPPTTIDTNILGSKRFVFRTAFAGARSIDAATGGDYRILTSEQGGVYDVYGFARLKPELFLFEAMAASSTSPSGGSPTILVGDGLGTPTPWLAAADRGEDASVKHANSHVAWVRGFGQKKLNMYDSVEIWTAELDASGGPVSPRKIETVAGATTNSVFAAGGHGRFAAVFNIEGARVCDLVTASCRDVLFPLPSGNPKVMFSRLVGLTSTHLWIELNQDRMFRLKLLVKMAR